jgi:hypothetical protein
MWVGGQFPWNTPQARIRHERERGTKLCMIIKDSAVASSFKGVLR